MPAPKKEDLAQKLDQVLEKLEELSAEIGVLAELNKAPAGPGVSPEVYQLLQHDYHELNRKYTALVADRVKLPAPAQPIRPPAPPPLPTPAPAPLPASRPSHILRNY